LLSLAGLVLIPLMASGHIASTGGSGGASWLPSVLGAIVGAIGIAAAWWQHAILRRDRSMDRQEEQARWAKTEENDAKIAKREKWRSEYEDIRKLLDRAQKCYFSIRDHGPYTATRLSKLEVQTICLDCETLAKRVVTSLGDGLLQLKGKFEQVQQNSVSDEHNPTTDDLRRAALQERAARDLDDQITKLWSVLTEEWGSLRPQVRGWDRAVFMTRCGTESWQAG
jgi:hypothetical protein